LFAAELLGFPALISIVSLPLQYKMRTLETVKDAQDHGFAAQCAACPLFGAAHSRPFPVRKNECKGEQ
jgi:hypothetical protein